MQRCQGQICLRWQRSADGHSKGWRLPIKKGPCSQGPFFDVSLSDFADLFVNLRNGVRAVNQLFLLFEELKRLNTLEKPCPKAR